MRFELGTAYMLYQAFELTHAALAPYRAMSQFAEYMNASIYNPVSYTPMGKSISAACSVFNSITKRYGKPEWDISETIQGSKSLIIHIETVYSTPFCNLIKFQKQQSPKRSATDPKVLIIAPYPAITRPFYAAQSARCFQTTMSM